MLTFTFILIILAATFHEIATKNLEAISSLTVAATAHGIDTQQSWPFVTLSAFQHRALTVRSLSGALLLTMNPIVTAEQRDEWLTYSTITEAGWHDEGMGTYTLYMQQDIHSVPVIYNQQIN
jgi:hypothetical protein